MITAIQKTRKERVLDTLADGEWHDGYDLCHPGVGGSEGLRRVRELRAEGYSILKRLKPDRPEGSMVYQYRLDSDELTAAKMAANIPEGCFCVWEEIGSSLRVEFHDPECQVRHSHVIR